MSNEHLGGAYPCGDGNTIMPDVWGYLVVRFQVKSVLDIGCGFAHSTKWFGDLSLRAAGVEGWDEAIKGSLYPTSLIVHDYVKGRSPITEEFDLCWCAEVVEHIAEEFMDNYIADMQRCRVICITHAEPGQNGHHHVTLHNDEWWVAKMANYGLIHMPKESALLRLTDRYHSGWGRRTLMVFQNAKYPPKEEPQFVKLEPIY